MVVPIKYPASGMVVFVDTVMEQIVAHRSLSDPRSIRFRTCLEDLYGRTGAFFKELHPNLVKD